LNKWLIEFSCGNSYFNFDDMFKYVNYMILVLLVLNLHAWNVYMGLLCVCTKLMKNDVVVVDSWVNSWLFVVDVVMGCVVDELMPCVFIIMDWWCELGCCWEFWWNLVGLLKRCFDFKFCVTLSAFLYTYTCKQLLEWVWTFGRSKFGFLVEKRVGTRNFFWQNWWLVA